MGLPVQHHRSHGRRHYRTPERDVDQWRRSEEHTSELQSPCNLVCRLLLEKKKKHHLRSLRVKITINHILSKQLHRASVADLRHSPSDWPDHHLELQLVSVQSRSHLQPSTM